MRARALVLMSVLSLALAPSAAQSQRVVSRDCWSRFDRCGVRVYDRSYDAEIARVARQAASRARAETRGITNRLRAEARTYAAAARADARAWDRTRTRAMFRADELRSRIRDRFDSRPFIPRRSPNYRRW